MHVYCICIKYTLYVYIYTHICGSGYVYGHVATIHVHVAKCVHVCVHVFACVCVFVCTRVIFVRMSYLPHCIHTHTHTGDCGQRQARGSWKKSGRQERREARGNDACSTHSQKKSAVHILKKCLNPCTFFSRLALKRGE